MAGKGYGISLGDDENTLELIVVMVAHYECAKFH